MADALEVAEAELEAAQAALDENPDSRPAQVDYENKHAVFEELSALVADAPVPEPAEVE